MKEGHLVPALIGRELISKKVLEEVAKEYVRRLGAAGGHQRAKRLSPRRRKEISRLGGLARWGKKADPAA
jgi:hypothetical protein